MCQLVDGLSYPNNFVVGDRGIYFLAVGDSVVEDIDRLLRVHHGAADDPGEGREALVVRHHAVARSAVAALCHHRS